MTPQTKIINPDLAIYVVVQHTSDFPDHVAVRRHNTNSRGVWPAPICCLYDSIDEAWEDFRPMGLARLARAPQDDPVIVEVWL